MIFRHLIYYLSSKTGLKRVFFYRLLGNPWRWVFPSKLLMQSIFSTSSLLCDWLDCTHIKHYARVLTNAVLHSKWPRRDDKIFNKNTANQKMSNSKDIQGHLNQVAQGQEPQEKLEFDPQTGKLRVTRSPNPDNVVATKMAASGFFACTFESNTLLVLVWT